jgi:hypothetical protein
VTAYVGLVAGVHLLDVPSSSIKESWRGRRGSTCTELKDAGFDIFISGLSVLSIVNGVLLRRRQPAAQPGAPAMNGDCRTPT